MRKLIVLSVLCLFGALRATPVSDRNQKVVIPKEIYVDSFVKHTSDHDIVDIMVPLKFKTVTLASKWNGKNCGHERERCGRLVERALNNINFDSENEDDDNTAFFVEADVNDGKRVDHGLYVYKKNETKKILPTGRTASASSNNNKLVYFGASDGLFIYDVDSNSVVKYGPITDGIISIATDDEGKYIYILTEDHKLHKVTNNGETKEAVEDVVDAQEIVVDDSNNLYYYTSKNELFIKTDEGVHKMESLPPNPKSIKLIRPPFILFDSIVLLIDNSVFVAYSNGTAVELGIEFSPEARPTALGPEAIYVQFYAHNKKLYEYNIMAIMANSIFESRKEQTEALRNSADQIKHKLGTKKI